MLDWQRDLVRRTIEGAGDYPGVQLQFLLQRLEEYPEAIDAICDAIGDMGHWFREHAKEMRREALRRRGGAEVVPFEK